jgi:S-adenosylmethionine decarboxylase
MGNALRVDASSIEDDVIATTSFDARGSHWLIDCFGVDATLLADATHLEAMLCNAADDAGAKRLFQYFHRFGVAADSGVTGVVLLAESHITIHTWPDQRFAAIDLFLCGDTKPERALARIERELKPERIVTTKQARGDAS